MDRRRFLTCATGAAAFGISLAPRAGLAQSRVRILKQEVDGLQRRWSHRAVADPTGSAPTRNVERFELRSGDCKGGDRRATAGPLGQQTRARIERHVVTNLSVGQRGQFVYYLYFPSSEYNFLPNVITSTGQIFLYDNPRGDWGGGPLWLLESDPGSRRLFVKISSFYSEGGRLQSDQLRRYSVGDLGGSIPLDQWVQVVINFGLSAGGDGFVQTYLNGRGAVQYAGPTALPGVVAGYSYGIYQVRTNQYPGGAQAIPPQVVYYSGVGMARV